MDTSPTPEAARLALTAKLTAWRAANGYRDHPADVLLMDPTMDPSHFWWLTEFMEEWNACEALHQAKPEAPPDDPVRDALTELIDLEELRAIADRLKRPILFGVFSLHTPASRAALAEWERRMYEALPAAYRALGREWLGFPAPRLGRGAFRMES